MTRGYKRDQFETLTFMNSGQVVARYDPSSEIAFLIMDGSFLKHGSAERVRKYHNDARERVKDSPAALEMINETQLLTVVAERLSDEMLEEINACLDCTGRAAKLEERLSQMEPRPVVYSGVPGP